MKSLTYAEWARVGSDIKKMRATLLELWFHRGLQDHLTKREQDKSFRRIETGIDVLKSILEESMFKKIAGQYQDDHELFNVFYDSPAGNEPHPEPKRKEVDVDE